MKSSRHSSKEHAGKKSVGKVMSVLQQSTSGLVTNKSENNGPDQVLPAEGFVTCRRNQPVLLRKGDRGLQADEPISIPSLLQEAADSYPHVAALKARDRTSGEWKTWTYQQLHEDVQIVAKALIETGLQRHHSVAILGSNSPQWVTTHFAAISAGGIAAGVSTRLSAEDIARICIDCKADIIVVEKQTTLKKVLLIQHKLPELKAIVVSSGEPPPSDSRRLHRTHKKQILSWSELRELGKALPIHRLEERLSKVAINQCCVLVYTSGRSGSSKGVMLSHDNLTWSAKMALGFLRAPGFNKSPSPGEETLMSFLPLSHVSSLVVDLYYMLTVAGTIVFPDTEVLWDQDKFFKALSEVQPTILYGPPIIFERLYHHLAYMRRSVSSFKKFFIDWSNSQIRGKHGDFISSTADRRIVNVQHAIARRTVCKKYKDALGLGPKTLFICRGGSLPEGVLQFLSGFDIVVHPAFGQSECCGVLTANVPKRFCKFSSVGKAAPGVQVKLDQSSEKPSDSSIVELDFNTERGEVLGFGRNIFMGYLNRENETREVVNSDNWLKLGDTGLIDEEGFLVIMGFSPNLISLNTGERINPTTVEERVRMELPCVSHCLLVGEERDRLGILLTLDTDVDTETGLPSHTLSQPCQRWFRAARFDVKSVTDITQNMEDNGTKHVIQAGIDRVNLRSDRASHFVTEWQIIPHCFSSTTGELGQTGKVNRTFLTAKYAKVINQMFCGDRTRSSITSEQYQPYYHQLSQILEEEERLSSRNSQEPGGTPKTTHDNVDIVLKVDDEQQDMQILEDSEETIDEDDEHNVSKDSTADTAMSEDSRKSSNSSASSLESDVETSPNHAQAKSSVSEESVSKSKISRT